MKAEEFDKQVDELFVKCKSILCSKREDYSTDKDIFSNFKLVGEITNQPVDKVCLNLIALKTVRLGNLIGGDKAPKNEAIEDTILDLINYSVILQGILSERNAVVYKQCYPTHAEPPLTGPGLHD